MVDISFPGLGIETFSLNKTAFELFGLDVRWYGVCIMLGIIFAFGYTIFRSKQEGFTQDDVLDVGLYTVVAGILGARLYYVIMKPEIYFRADRTLWQNLSEIVNIRGGGLAIYGGIIGGALAILIYCYVRKKDWRRLLDMVSPGVMFAQAMGRWGNFFNGEAHGGIVTEGHPLYFIRMGLFPNDLHTPDMAFVHPTFLYESLWNILGFVLINAFVYRRKKFNGQIVLTYLAWYGFGRMLIEGLRTDSLYLGGGDEGIRVSQLVGLLCFLACTGLIVYMLIRVKGQVRAGTYIPVFPAPATAQAQETGEATDTTDTAEEAKTEQAEENKNEDTSKEEQDNGKFD